MTHIYGPKMSSVIVQHLDAQAAILDGEMTVWDNLNNQMAPFGLNKFTARSNDDAELAPDGDKQRYQLCFKIFDLLFLKDDQESPEIVLMGATLQERQKALRKAIKEDEVNVLELVQGQLCQTSEEVFSIFNQSVDNNEEGVIIKDPQSTYRPNERSKDSWIKLKSEYFEELSDTLDLIIIGGFFGERRRAGGAAGSTAEWTDHITVFLMGVIKKVDLKDVSNASVIPFCKVGTGYSMEELGELRSRLRGNWRMYDARVPPNSFAKWTPAMSERPDVYISDLSKSVVLEVKAGELVISEQYPTFYTLRFPRVVKIRYDKDWHEALNQQGLNELISNFNEARRMNKNKHKLFEHGGDTSGSQNEEELADQGISKPRKKRKLNKNGDGKQGDQQ